MIELVLFVHYNDGEGIVPIEVATDIAGDFGKIESKFKEVDEFLGQLYQIDALSFDKINEYQLSLRVENSDGDFDIADESCFYPAE